VVGYSILERTPVGRTIVAPELQVERFDSAGLDQTLSEESNMQQSLPGIQSVRKIVPDLAVEIGHIAVVLVIAPAAVVVLDYTAAGLAHKVAADHIGSLQHTSLEAS